MPLQLAYEPMIRYVGLYTTCAINSTVVIVNNYNKYKSNAINCTMKSYSTYSSITYMDM